MELPTILASALYKGLELWTTPVLRFRIRPDRVLVEFMPKDSPRQNIDERIAKIEAARHNLTEALGAIDELKLAAEKNKAELAEALQRLTSTQAQKAHAEKELQTVREIAQSDVEVFKKLAGVPSQTEIAKERFVGFLLGITASVLASGIWWLLSKEWPLLKT